MRTSPSVYVGKRWQVGLCRVASAGFRSGLTVLGLVSLAATLCADTTSPSGATEITSLPRVITQPGVYFLNQNFEVGGSQNGIVVNAAGVTINLNGHTISNLSGGKGVYDTGIYNPGYSRMTVRNGTIKGFSYGVFAAAGEGDLVENMRFLESTYAGVRLDASGSIVRHCQAYKIGGSTQPSMPNGVGFLINSWNVTVQDCDASELITNTAYQTIGVYFATDYGQLALGNRINGAELGIYVNGGAATKYRDNLCAASVTTPYTGGTNAGNN